MNITIRHNGWSEYWDGESAQWVPVQDNSAPVQPKAAVLPGNDLSDPSAQASNATSAGKRPWFCHDGWTNQ